LGAVSGFNTGLADIVHWPVVVPGEYVRLAILCHSSKTVLCKLYY